MTALPFADNFLTGSWLTILMPLAVLIAIAVWYAFAVQRVPADSPPALPSDEVVRAAGPGAVADVTLQDDVTPMDEPGDEA